MTKTKEQRDAERQALLPGLFEDFSYRLWIQWRAGRRSY